MEKEIRFGMGNITDERELGRNKATKRIKRKKSIR